ncbi:hypothetical protein HN858_02215 [Candidatus Falkowbacteria bacterium]|nr:hypothetical protein [Candidatus Falkowbacteria bacterium]MBT5502801.1 hypothetical protein [Candidatus Falkowbacteria bacterium]MBT6573429.1 hypothetical protein [Candidatus Falkowbacteria bacterium]MBT7348470.1 hypothetical protein [Candidatus Falkowbacteria bacterium]MBT7501186.1 hypothetical protein [Candidatus Falkowbacteria bacterium]
MDIDQHRFRDAVIHRMQHSPTSRIIDQWNARSGPDYALQRAQRLQEEMRTYVPPAAKLPLDLLESTKEVRPIDLRENPFKWKPMDL